MQIVARQGEYTLKKIAFQTRSNMSCGGLIDDRKRSALHDQVPGGDVLPLHLRKSLGMRARASGKSWRSWRESSGIRRRGVPGVPRRPGCGDMYRNRALPRVRRWRERCQARQALAVWALPLIAALLLASLTLGPHTGWPPLRQAFYSVANVT